MFNLVIDKSSIQIDQFLASIKIVNDFGGEISKEDFIKSMMKYMGEADGNSDNRKYINKSKWSRYYGFLRIGEFKSGNLSTLTITGRGVKLLDECVEVVENEENYNIKIKEGMNTRFIDLVMESIIYDSFGCFNDGVETSVSDVAPPKVVLKAMKELTYLTKEESAYLFFSLDCGEHNSYEEAINQITKFRGLGDIDGLEEKLDNMEKLNFARDNKLIKFLADIKLIEKDENNKYYIVDEYLNRYNKIINSLEITYKPIQKIFFGAPGTGKSYHIYNEVLSGINKKNCLVRVNFHPEYSYSDFIGHIAPKKDGESIEYEFKPGPFTKIIELAYICSKQNFCLVIEEINRGNSAAIFGDVFQLLDRAEGLNSKTNGWSKYSINNNDIFQYLITDSKLKNILKKFDDEGVLPYGKIKLPPNLHILATMNTADQNVFVLDTAFKRRFQMEYVPISFNKFAVKELNKYDVIFKGEKKLDELFNSVDLVNFIKINNLERNWSGFALLVNKLIDIVNEEFNEISEDKKLGPFFVQKDDLINRKSFVDKVLYYLKDDVFKYNDRYFVKTYSQIYIDYVINEKDIFEVLFSHQFGDGE